jgi:hypothetical protein
VIDEPLHVLAGPLQLIEQFGIGLLLGKLVLEVLQRQVGGLVGVVQIGRLAGGILRFGLVTILARLAVGVGGVALVIGFAGLQRTSRRLIAAGR